MLCSREAERAGVEVNGWVGACVDALHGRAAQGSEMQSRAEQFSTAQCSAAQTQQFENAATSRCVSSHSFLSPTTVRFLLRQRAKKVE